jgi:hypothetical protein
MLQRLRMIHQSEIFSNSREIVDRRARGEATRFHNPVVLFDCPLNIQR